MLKIMFWNCRGFPWHKGSGLNDVLDDAEIVFLAETWERDVHRIPTIQGYMVHSLWQTRVGTRGQGGIACMYKECLQDIVTLCKDDPYKRYIWIKIEMKPMPLYIAGCYIPHRESPYYPRYGKDASDPFGDLCSDVVHFSSKGRVIIVGDMNARIGNAQIQPLTEHEYNKEEETEIDDMWHRCSQDKETNAHGDALMTLINGLQMIVLNGTCLFPSTKVPTCFPASGGQSVVDYALASIDAIHQVVGYEIGPKLPESDHTPLYLRMRMPHLAEVKTATAENWSFRMDTNKREQYEEALDALLKDMCRLDWNKMKEALFSTAQTVLGQRKNKRTCIKGLPCNRWFDEECKSTRSNIKHMPNGPERREAEKLFHALNRRKRRKYLVEKEWEDAIQFAKNPKGTWRNTKERKKDIMGDFTEEEMLKYVKQLYMHPDALPMVGEKIYYTGPDIFNIHDVNEGLKKMANGKAPDTLHFNTEMLKWTKEYTRGCLVRLLNNAIENGFPLEWQDNWLKPIYKGGDRNQLTNYRTIMVGSTMAKLFSTIIENKLSLWAEFNKKRAVGQAGFRKNHNTADHLTTLRVLMEESRLRGQPLFCCFIDFKKAFDTVPRNSLWERLVHLEVPLHLRMAIFRMYEKVACQLKGNNGLSDIFYSNMGVKQGCPLSPTLFGLCIDKLEELIQMMLQGEQPNSPQICGYTILLLLYADDVVFFSYTAENMQRMMHILQKFCLESGLTVNVNKTKIMVIQTIQPANIPSIIYDGKEIERVQTFKYLGIDVPSSHKWGDCVQRRMDAGWGKYYRFENDCRNNDTTRWDIRRVLFDAYVIQTVLYGVEVWGGSITASKWNDIEKMQKSFLKRQLGIRTTTPYSIMLLETGCRPIELRALERVFKYIQRLKDLQPHRLPKRAWEASKRPQKTNKSKMLSSGWWSGIKDWFQRWEVASYLGEMPRAKEERTFNAALLEALHRKWQSAEIRTKYEYYCQHINPNYWATYSQKENHAQKYISTPISLRARRSIALIRTRSHSLEVERRAWEGVSREQRFCRLCNLGEVENEAHVLLSCPRYKHIREDFSKVTKDHNSLESLLSHPHLAALGNYITKVLVHRDQCITQAATC